MTGNEYLHFMARRFTDFIAMPKEKRKTQRKNSYEKGKLRKTDWFGNAPFYMYKMMKKEK